MREDTPLRWVGVGLLSVGSLALPAGLRVDEPPKVQIPKPGVPQIMTIEGRYVRAAYNNEGYAILGYRLANLSVGEPWMLLEVGVALRDGVKDYTLTREALSLETPDGKTIPLPSISEYREADLRALQSRERVQRDSINYFPPNAHQACRIGFFAELDSGAHALCIRNLFNKAAFGQYVEHVLCHLSNLLALFPIWDTVIDSPTARSDQAWIATSRHDCF